MAHNAKPKKVGTLINCVHLVLLPSARPTEASTIMAVRFLQACYYVQRVLPTLDVYDAIWDVHLCLENYVSDSPKISVLSFSPFDLFIDSILNLNNKRQAF